MFRDLAPFIVTGLLTGTIYGLLSTGLVLTFKTSGIFNFGHGAILSLASLAFYWMHVDKGWDWKIAFFISVFVLGPLIGLVMEVVGRSLTERSTSMKVVGTVGLSVLVPSLILIKYPQSSNGFKVERFLPFSNRQKYKVDIFDVKVFGDQIFIAAIAILCVVGLFMLFRYSRLGLAMRAAVDDSELLALTGTEPKVVRRIAWMIGCSFAALSGVLLLPSVTLQPYALTFLATYAFGAAAIGSFRSVPLAFVGGLVVGVGEDVSGFFIRREKWMSLSGLPVAIAFVILFATLIIFARRLKSEERLVERRARPYRAPLELRLGTGVVVFAALSLAPTLFSNKLPYFTFGLCQAILILSLGLLVRTSGQLSLCHATFAAIGAVTFSQFTTQMNMPWLLALLCSIAVTIPVGALVALPAIRLSGIYLALATLGFGYLVQALIFPQSWMFATISGSRPVKPPSGFNTPTKMYFLVLIVLAVCAILIAIITQSRLGRILRGMGESPTAVSTLGLSTTVTKLIVFCISAGMAAVAGVMYGNVLTNVDSATTSFQQFNSLVLIAILTLAPFREPWYAVFAGVTAVIPGFITGASVPYWINGMFGLFAILVAMQGGHPAMSDKLRARLDTLGRKRSVVVPEHEPRPRVSSGVGLEVDHINVAFGGLKAVDDLSLEAPIGRITGLIGPNGAGKTTTFNVISGINRNHGGGISYIGKDVSGLAMAGRGRLGIGRTFQRMDLANALSVAENVALGVESGQAGNNPWRQVFSTRSERKRCLTATQDAMELCGIAHLAESQAGALSTGERRLVELARCLAGSFDLLLLDEPSSGLDRTETERFGAILKSVVAARGCGILLVEHDMELVMDICDYMYVLDFGRLLFEGTPSEVANSDVVRAAYLGTEVVGAADGGQQS